ncbi:ArnT family glycosyltransferase [Planctomicrobium piriforme]|uniref:4-amino-4-deoxy-L-arabinose transferase n=1 Tax=Planctomicrobium piriforme TaxID=1576369 RepID=A0A1I3PXI6_9PLAN|nr:hypothetical protein [Planctomicrobium piriforme]SFJ26095.1 4-amino-4-deoxy-L-arabinose transferase [Planctomicrobium piriforme]
MGWNKLISSPQTPGATPWLLRHWDLLLLALFWTGVLLIRIRFLSLPFERDEGEYAYGGQLILDGIPLYRELYTLKWPGTHLSYALILALLGQSIAGVHFGLLLINTAAAAMLYPLARCWLNRPFAVFATASFLTLTLSPAAHGVIANAEHFALLWIVPGLYCLDRGLRRGRSAPCLQAGIFLQAAVVCKQPALMFVIGGCIVCAGAALSDLRCRQGWRNLAAYLAGNGIVGLTLVSLILYWGVWDDFVFWTMTYARDYTSQNSLPLAAWTFYQMLYWVIGGTWPIYVLSVIGLISAAATLPWRSSLTVGSFWLASGAAVATGFYFRPHYFLFAAPVTALLAGFAVQTVADRLQRPTWLRTGWLVGCAASLVFCFFIERLILFRITMPVAIRAIHPGYAFVESPLVGEYLKERLPADGRVFILGSEPQICFYAHRRSATGFIYLYPFFEKHPHQVAMQQRLIDQVEAAKPEYVIVTRTHPFFDPDPNWEGPLLDWIPRFLSGYEQCGIAIAKPEGVSFFDFAPAQPVPLPPAADLILYRRQTPSDQSIPIP